MPTIDATQSLAILLDALDGELTQASKDALKAQLNILNPAGVAPGDLITADLFNRMLSDIEDLMTRVAALEEAGDDTVKAPRIIRFEPSIVRTGSQFAVIGEGLNPAHIQQILIENSFVPTGSIKAGSTATRLLLDAPAILSLPSAGGPVILSMTNAAGTAEGSYTQLPGVAANIQANIGFVPQGLTPNEAIVANKVYTARIELDIHSSHDETFDVAAAFDTAGWQIQSVNPASVTVTAQSANDGHKQVIEIGLRTGASGSAKLSLRVRGRVFTAFEQVMVPDLTLEVAQTTQLPSPLIKFGTIEVAGPHGWDGAAARVMIHRPSISSPEAFLSVPTQCDLVGSYSIQNLVVQPAADWPTVVIDGQNFQINQVGGIGNVRLRLTPEKDANEFTAANGTLSFEIVSQNGQHRRPFSAQLVVLPA